MAGGVNIKDDGQMRKYREDASALSTSVAPREVFGGVVAPAGSDASDKDDGDRVEEDKSENGAASYTRITLVGVVGMAGLAVMLA